MSRIGENMRKRRMELGLTQARMAQLLIIHRTTYTKYELGYVEPPLDTLCHIADLLTCSTDYLLGRE